MINRCIQLGKTFPDKITEVISKTINGQDLELDEFLQMEFVLTEALQDTEQVS